MHPYTKDQYTGASINTTKTQQAAVPDLNTRLQVLEGMLRGHATPGTIADPDKRLDQMEARLYAIERNLNGLAGVPAVGANALSLTYQNMLDYGDA